MSAFDAGETRRGPMDNRLLERGGVYNGALCGVSSSWIGATCRGSDSDVS